MDNDAIKKREDRVICLLSELNSTLDLYYEKAIEIDVVTEEL